MTSLALEPTRDHAGTVGAHAPSVAWRKRGLDLVAGSLLLLVALPIMVLVAVLVACTSQGPVLFRQERYGLDGRRFRMFKFRTMHVDAEARLQRLMRTDPRVADEMTRTWKLRHDPRVTRVGWWLRRLSLDELPQLANVVRGDMSLVGPRPRRHTAELAAYGADVDLLLQVRPGLTGPWQVSGRNNLPEELRVVLDLGYAQAPSVREDLRLLARTVPTLLRPARNGAC